MRLSDLLSYDDIVIQCHDNPDADALASGAALHWYFTQKGKKSGSSIAAITRYRRAI